MYINYTRPTATYHICSLIMAAFYCWLICDVDVIRCCCVLYSVITFYGIVASFVLCFVSNRTLLALLLKVFFFHLSQLVTMFYQWTNSSQQPVVVNANWCVDMFFRTYVCVKVWVHIYLQNSLARRPVLHSKFTISLIKRLTVSLFR